MKSREPPDSGYWDLSGDALAMVLCWDLLRYIAKLILGIMGYVYIYIYIGYYSMKVQRPHAA